MLAIRLSEWLGLRCAQARRPGAGVLATLFAMLLEPGTRVLVHTTSINKKATARVAFSLIGALAQALDRFQVAFHGSRFDGLDGLQRRDHVDRDFAQAREDVEF